MPVLDDIFARRYGDPAPLAQDAEPPRKRMGVVRPNVGIAIAYRKKLRALIDEMAASVEYWLTACYRKHEPVMARDETPAAELQKAIDKLSRQWLQNIEDGASPLAVWFAKQAKSRSEAQLRSILRKAGISVRFQWRMTAAMRDVFRATVEENVGLIKSIPQQYLGDVQGLVMRSVQRGGDLGGLTKELRKRYGITQRRAAFISNDQNSKAVSAMQKVRQVELGIEEGVWRHSQAGREPRPTHLANDGKKFKIKTGWYDPDPKVRRYIMPGELPNCRCSWQPVVKGFS